ncbi:MAG: methylated-DNA--[protein]-cysteine S-methyltransferase [Planctomycetota bacterium]
METFPRIVSRELDTPLGAMLAGVVDDPAANRPALCLLEFCDRPRLPRELEELAAAIGPVDALSEFESATPAARLFDETESQLDSYFRRARTVFDLPVLAPGTDFQQAVWSHLQTIPHGTTTTYGDIARALDRPGAQRAVGAANGANRISIIIPCHRVIDANGKLHGYGGGIARKRTLLELERASLFS